MVERLPLVEHRLGERTLEASGDRDGADEVQAAGPDLVGEPDDMACPDHVGTLGLVRRREQVVDGGQVEPLGAAQLLAVVR